MRDSPPDTAPASRDLGPDPRFSFEEGLRRTLEWRRTQPRQGREYRPCGEFGRTKSC